jgi:hypothetical protein
LVLLCRHSNDVNLQIYFKKYSKILSKVIITTKKKYYNRIILNSNDKIKSTWKIINEERGKPKRNGGTQSMMFDNMLIRNQKEIADIFN